MPDVSFANLVVVCAIAFATPLLLGLVPRVRVPAVALEIVLGIIVGPSGLGWVHVDLPIQVLSLFGLAFLLFLAGLEVDVDRLRGRPLLLAIGGYGVSFGLAAAAGFALSAADLATTPLLVAVILSATGLGIVVPVLKDAGEVSSPFGQAVIAASSVADFGAVILLTLLFSKEATGGGAKVLLLSAFALLAAVIGVGIARAGRGMRIASVLERLQDTTAQIRVRGAVLLLVGLTALAERLGLEAILGAFIAGAILTVVDRDRMMTHEHFRVKLEAIGFGVFVPVFFVTSGLRFDVHALFASVSAVARVPLFLGVLLIVRGSPALAFRRAFGSRRAVGAALLQATSLSFIVASVQIGIELGLLDAATGAALVAAGLLSVLAFPAIALALLRRSKEPARARAAKR